MNYLTAEQLHFLPKSPDINYMDHRKLATTTPTVDVKDLAANISMGV